ncbi:GSCFA domain-containing protein [Paracoccus xiamenensis]|uniref:GSCFA domain-containing protein n=1 Tax=Paracoccus xiamenensis TaxID=2714901 RepID=UPI001409E512|nr:GSCFA domain-containing protein [Paracoccus xiamenensis]NHF74018.1 GSCFA domain-containing protein [Paracoccus xiamenensis]
MNPYTSQPDRAYWKRGVGTVHYSKLFDMWQPITLSRSDRIATAGSCFAQHIGNNLARRGASYMDMEPAPIDFADEAEARRWGFGVFSCRYGNVYTSRQLIQLFHEAHGNRTPLDAVWERNGRFFDALRPGIDPVGQASPEEVTALRQRHLAAVRKMFAELDLFVFTMGLTEGWEHRVDGTMYPMAPGTVAGEYDPQKHVFRNLRYGEVMADMTEFWSALRAVNLSARMLLTVSPVPLAATATDNHVMVATSYSKSVLRAVAGDLVAELDGVSYFPSYEIISSHPARGMYFEPDLRNVSQYGVDYVMSHFFSGPMATEFAQGEAEPEPAEELELICDESKLDA